MSTPLQIARSAAVSGSIASIVSTAVLALLSTVEGRGAVQPTNATSHWWYGDRAARAASARAGETTVGYATHHAAAIFWARLFETLRSRLSVRSVAGSAQLAAATAMVAAVVDYGIVPKRLTPGWELVLSRKSTGAAFLALAVGLTCGGLVSEPRR
jgi:hypothetical protein